MGGERILIVEDEGITALDLQQRLTAMGYTACDIVATGEEAVARAGETRPDLVLMDIMLQGDKDGIAAADEIHSLFNIPIVFLTAYADRETVRRAKAAEPHGYLIKPVHERELNITVDMALFRHAMEEKVRKALGVKSDFTAMVSHELRTPLTAVKEGIDLVLDEVFGEINEDQRSSLQLAKKNVDRLRRLIDDVLDFQRLESGGARLTFKMEEGDLNDMVRQIREVMLPVAQKRGLDVILDLSDCPPIRFDQDKMIQVLMNLMDNALKFTEKGSITLSTRAKIDSVRISVADTGPGIGEEDLTRLFKPYVQLQRRTQGTGLGLAISAMIVEAHGGRIWAESKAGEGTIFRISLPCLR